MSSWWNQPSKMRSSYCKCWPVKPPRTENFCQPQSSSYQEEKYLFFFISDSMSCGWKLWELACWKNCFSYTYFDVWTKASFPLALCGKVFLRSGIFTWCNSAYKPLRSLSLFTLSDNLPWWGSTSLTIVIPSTVHVLYTQLLA